ncbi:MAG: hypothetical protein IJ002_03190 [Clostridia bacterium]|nr:hypothetical protein [Clostridia bacterium]MBQ8836497.1 hypothetical protein [Clostridia bacterium]
MKYLIIGNTAVLASRDIERITETGVDVSVVGIPDGATLNIQRDTTARHYGIVSENAKVPREHMADEGIYNVNIRWKEFIDGAYVDREAYGNPFKIIVNDGEPCIIPAPQASGVAVDEMWRGISNLLEIILPLIDTLKNGNDVI